MRNLQQSSVALVGKRRARGQSVLLKWGTLDILPASLMVKRRTESGAGPRRKKLGFSMRKCVLPSLFPEGLLGLDA